MADKNSDPRGNQPIEDYGVIGDLNTVALVGMDASIDFLCLPDFDSPAVFAKLLDPDKGGSFSVEAKLERSRSKQMYLPETNILTTRLQSEEGVAEIDDFMPVLDVDTHHRVVRTVRVIKGTIDFRVRCCPRFDYGRQKHTAESHGDRIVEFLMAESCCPPVRLLGGVPLRVVNDDVQADFSLKAGEHVSFVFECGVQKESPAEVDRETIKRWFQETSIYWRAWAAKSNYKGRWREMVTRSALVLKLLTSRKHGAIIAAPTFGLPERIGGERNWDYRYAWLRDASFTLYAFMRLGYNDEALSFMMWLKERIGKGGGDGPLQVMYRVSGNQDLAESSLDNFSGYMNSCPVRIGNAASKQLQLDIYGELIDAMYLASKYGPSPSYDGWKRLSGLIDWLSQNWQRPDEGIWEVRGGRHEFLHSRMMCWVAVDRAVRLGRKRSLPVPGAWDELRTEIYENIFAEFWNEDLQSFVAYKGANFVDASALLMPLMRFISPMDRRWQSTMKKIEADLTEDALVYRYNNLATGVDGLEGTEGTFTACSFWYIECLARANQLDKARLLFERMISYANHLGLYSEQLGASGEHLGNFPQALTHLALISAASYLDRALSGSNRGEWR